MLPLIVRYVALASLTVPSMAQPGGTDGTSPSVPDSVVSPDAIADLPFPGQAPYDSVLKYWRQRTDRLMRDRALENAAVDPLIVAFPAGREPSPMPNAYREKAIDPRILIDPGPRRMKPQTPQKEPLKPPGRAKP